jgi:hypothetical protein
MNEEIENIEDLYNVKKPSKGLYVLLAIIFATILVFWLVSTSEKPTQKGAFVKICEDMMLKSENNYTICCVEGDNIIDCTDKKTFDYNDYIIVHANLFLLNKNFFSYHACAFYTPLETIIESKGRELSEIRIDDEEVVCSERLWNTYHYVENFGYIKNYGKITLMKIYIFPSLGYNTTQDFVNDLDKGILVLNVTADVV